MISQFFNSIIILIYSIELKKILENSLWRNKYFKKCWKNVKWNISHSKNMFDSLWSIWKSWSYHWGWSSWSPLPCSLVAWSPLPCSCRSDCCSLVRDRNLARGSRSVRGSSLQTGRTSRVIKQTEFATHTQMNFPTPKVKCFFFSSIKQHSVLFYF